MKHSPCILLLLVIFVHNSHGVNKIKGANHSLYGLNWLKGRTKESLESYPFRPLDDPWFRSLHPKVPHSFNPTFDKKYSLIVERYLISSATNPNNFFPHSSFSTFNSKQWNILLFGQTGNAPLCNVLASHKVEIRTKLINLLFNKIVPSDKKIIDYGYRCPLSSTLYGKTIFQILVGFGTPITEALQSYLTRYYTQLTKKAITTTEEGHIQDLQSSIMTDNALQYVKYFPFIKSFPTPQLAKFYINYPVSFSWDGSKSLSYYESRMSKGVFNCYEREPFFGDTFFHQLLLYPLEKVKRAMLDSPDCSHIHLATNHKGYTPLLKYLHFSSLLYKNEGRVADSTFASLLYYTDVLLERTNNHNIITANKKGLLYVSLETRLPLLLDLIAARVPLLFNESNLLEHLPRLIKQRSEESVIFILLHINKDLKTEASQSDFLHAMKQIFGVQEKFLASQESNKAPNLLYDVTKMIRAADSWNTFMNSLFSDILLITASPQTISNSNQEEEKPKGLEDKIEDLQSSIINANYNRFYYLLKYFEAIGDANVLEPLQKNKWMSLAIKQRRRTISLYFLLRGSAFPFLHLESIDQLTKDNLNEYFNREESTDFDSIRKLIKTEASTAFMKLIEESNIDLNANDGELMHNAEEPGVLAAVIRRGGNPNVNLVEGYLYRALHFGNTTLLSALASQGINAFIYNYEGRTPWNWIPLAPQTNKLVFDNNYSRNLELLATHKFASLRQKHPSQRSYPLVLLEYGQCAALIGNALVHLDPTYRDYKGRSIAMIALSSKRDISEKNKTTWLEMLAKKTIDLEHTDNLGRIVHFYAAQYGDIAKEFMNSFFLDFFNSGRAKTVDNNGNTIFHYYCMNPRATKDFAMQFVKQGLHLMKNHEGHLPIHFFALVKNSAPGVFKYLLEVTPSNDYTDNDTKRSMKSLYSILYKHKMASNSRVANDMINELKALYPNDKKLNDYFPDQRVVM